MFSSCSGGPRSVRDRPGPISAGIPSTDADRTPLVHGPHPNVLPTPKLPTDQRAVRRQREDRPVVILSELIGFLFEYVHPPLSPLCLLNATFSH